MSEKFKNIDTASPSVPAKKRTSWMITLEATGILGGLFFVAVWVWELPQRQFEREALQEEFLANKESRKFQAWNLLNASSSGDMGKSDALNYLISQEPEISGLQIYCNSVNSPDVVYHGLGLNDCDYPPILHQISSREYKLKFTSIDLRKAILTDWDVPGMICKGCDFRGANMVRISAPGAVFYGELDGSDWEDCNLIGSKLSSYSIDGLNFGNCDMTDTTLKLSRKSGSKTSRYVIGGSNISGMKISMQPPEVVHFFSAWYWADKPPKTLTENYFFGKEDLSTPFMKNFRGGISVCDPAGRGTEKLNANGMVFPDQKYCKQVPKPQSN